MTEYMEWLKSMGNGYIKIYKESGNCSECNWRMDSARWFRGGIQRCHNCNVSLVISQRTYDKQIPKSKMEGFTAIYSLLDFISDTEGEKE